MLAQKEKEEKSFHLNSIDSRTVKSKNKMIFDENGKAISAPKRLETKKDVKRPQKLDKKQKSGKDTTKKHQKSQTKELKCTRSSSISRSASTKSI